MERAKDGRARPVVQQMKREAGGCREGIEGCGQGLRKGVAEGVEGAGLEHRGCGSSVCLVHEDDPRQAQGGTIGDESARHALLKRGCYHMRIVNVL